MSAEKNGKVRRKEGNAKTKDQKGVFKKARRKMFALLDRSFLVVSKMCEFNEFGLV